MTKEELHSQVTALSIFTWHTEAIIHAMIDLDIITEIACQRDDCLYPDQPFTKSRRGDPHLICIDHIHQRHLGGIHRVQNFRIMHLGCNAGWRKGLTGTFHTSETRALISEKVKRAHSDGKLKKIYTPARNAKISAANKGRTHSEDVRARMRGPRPRVSCSDCGRTYAKNWITRHKDEGQCLSTA